ncbi:MAG: TerC/Alx family metal homeostasis membrane protein [Bacteroidetes bacterium]|nr:TerC/Alx family metal homeostasis membrane protein [Bacteroidota bacterium]
MHLKKAIYWSIFWIALSLLFNVGVYYTEGHEKALEFFTGYLIEKVLSVDNLFVFLIIFKIFGVELKDQRRVLNWGIIGVIILRGILILIGAKLVHEFEWILLFFGAILIYTGFHVVFGEEKKIDPDKNIVVRLFKKLIPVTTQNAGGHHFFIRIDKKIYATTLFICLIVIETTDVVFAADSIPAIFAITTDPFIILSSNLMAVLGLRSLYFVLEELHTSFNYVKFGVGIVLVFVGIKMLISEFYKINTTLSFTIVISILIASVVFSLFKQNKSSV